MGPLEILLPLVRMFVNTAATGAWPTLQAATGPVSPGACFGPIGFREIRGVSVGASRSAQAVDLLPARRLWDVSVAMTGIDPGLAPLPGAWKGVP
jgi:hypothetical protein